MRKTVHYTDQSSIPEFLTVRYRINFINRISTVLSLPLFTLTYPIQQSELVRNNPTFLNSTSHYFNDLFVLLFSSQAPRTSLSPASHRSYLLALNPDVSIRYQPWQEPPQWSGGTVPARATGRQNEDHLHGYWGRDTSLKTVEEWRGEMESYITIRFELELCLTRWIQLDLGPTNLTMINYSIVQHRFVEKCIFFQMSNSTVEEHL